MGLFLPGEPTVPPYFTFPGLFPLPLPSPQFAAFLRDEDRRVFRLSTDWHLVRIVSFFPCSLFPIPLPRKVFFWHERPDPCRRRGTFPSVNGGGVPPPPVRLFFSSPACFSLAASPASQKRTFRAADSSFRATAFFLHPVIFRADLSLPGLTPSPLSGTFLTTRKDFSLISSWSRIAKKPTSLDLSTSRASRPPSLFAFPANKAGSRHPG